MSSRAMASVRSRRFAFGSGVALALATSFALAAVRARAHEQLTSAGAAMLAYARAQHVEGPRSLLVNGAPLRLTTGTTRDSVDDVLDALRARCRSRGPDRSALGRLERELSALGLDVAALDGIVRAGDQRAGFLACLDLGEAKLDARRLLTRVRAFLASGDLAALGELRFVWAERSGERTNFVAVWSEGRLPLREMFPARGEAPGADLREVPRPSGTRRILCAAEARTAPELVAYRSELPSVNAAQRYLAELARAGFSLRPTSIATSKRAERTWLVQTGTSYVALAIADADNASLLVVVPLH